LSSSRGCLAYKQPPKSSSVPVARKVKRPTIYPNTNVWRIRETMRLPTAITDMMKLARINPRRIAGFHTRPHSN